MSSDWLNLPELVSSVRQDMRESTDAHLCETVRLNTDEAARREAFAELYARHRDVVFAQALAIAQNQIDAEDLVSEAFTRVFRALRNGNGPTESVLGYLLVTLRSEAIRSYQAKEATVSALPEALNTLADESVADFGDTLQEQDQVSRAFAQLPEDLRRVLWLVDVEQQSAKFAAEYLDMQVGAVRVLVHRARKKLASAYLQQYVEISASACTAISAKLAEYVRGEAGKRAIASIEHHLPNCRFCTVQVSRLRDLGQHLRVWAGPMFVGGSSVGLALSGSTEPTVSAAQLDPRTAGLETSTRKITGLVGVAVGSVLTIGGLLLLFPPEGVSAPENSQTSVETTAPGNGDASSPSVEESDSVPSVGPLSPQILVDPKLLDGKSARSVDDSSPHWKLKN